MRPPPRSTLFPYTTLFRSHEAVRSGNLGRLPHARLRGVAARGTAERGGEDRLREHPGGPQGDAGLRVGRVDLHEGTRGLPDRKSTRLNSSHMSISYAVFCL